MTALTFPGGLATGKGGRAYWRPGFWYAPLSTATTGAPANESLHAVPLTVPPEAAAIDRIGVEVTVAGATGALVRLGVYADDGNGYPGELLLDAGTLPAASAGQKEIAVALALEEELLWLAYVAQAAPVTLPTIRVLGSATAVAPIGAATPGSSAAAWRVSAAVPGELPATFPTSGVVPNGGGPRVAVRAS